MDPNRILTPLDTFKEIFKLCKEQNYQVGPVPALIQHYLAQAPESELKGILQDILFETTPECNTVRIVLLSYLCSNKVISGNYNI